MHGVTASPIYTQQLKEITDIISDSVRELPTTISELIGQYKLADIALTVRKIRLDQDGMPINDDENNATIEAQKEALTSSRCPTDIKLAMLKNISGSRSQIHFFNQLCKEVADSGYQVDLDNMNFGRLRLEGLNWSCISCKNAQFDLTFQSVLLPGGADIGHAIIGDGQRVCDFVYSTQIEAQHT